MLGTGGCQGILVAMLVAYGVSGNGGGELVDGGILRWLWSEMLCPRHFWLAEWEFSGVLSASF
jgi:hypothetical protein